MKCFTVPYQGQEYEVCLKTRKDEKPKTCEACDEPINKGDYFSMTDAGECYCLGCSTE